jgi:hypothetical protein
MSGPNQALVYPQRGRESNIQTMTTAISPRSVTLAPNFNFKIASPYHLI